MKKLWIPMVLLLLLLAACMSVPEGETAPSSSTPSSSTPSSSSITPPSSVPPTVPTTQPAAPTTPNDSTGHARIHKEYISPVWDEYDLSNCVIGYLYWLDKDTHTVTLLLAEEIEHEVTEGEYIYFVKKAEPSKIYRMLIAAPERYELVHETPYGNISCLDVSSYPDVLFQLVIDKKKFVVHDMATDESTVLMEQLYINMAFLFLNEDGTWGDIIEFEGKHEEDDSPYTIYDYNWKTGELSEDRSL